MSSENVNLINRIYEAFGRGSFPSSLTFYDPRLLLLSVLKSLGRHLSWAWRGEKASSKMWPDT
jgi:hypothetical protein